MTDMQIVIFDDGRGDVRHANDAQVEQWLALSLTVVPHRFLARHGDESIRDWMLADHEGNPVWVDEGGVVYDIENRPYPWCRGNPTKAHCVAAGYCRRNPNCGD